MRDVHLGHIVEEVGKKRKRVASTNENNHSGGRSNRGTGRQKRLRSISGSSKDYTSDEGNSSSMDVDIRWNPESSVEPQEIPEESQEPEEDDEEDDETSDDYLINSAPAPQLQRLRKDDLLRLYALAGLSDDAESLTKSEIVDCIVAARDDLASLPPSSPPGRGGDLSDYSSDDGNFAENEADEERADETPRGVFSLRRRATTTDVCHLNGRPSKGRSLSLGQMNDSTAAVPSALSKKLSGKSSPTGVLKRRTSSRSSPATSISAQSPPGTRLRTRKLSNSADSDATRPAAGSRSKGKGKQVEFSHVSKLKSIIPTKRPSGSSAQSSSSSITLDDESDLTELDESENEPHTGLGQPSPRRLRSKDKYPHVSSQTTHEESFDARRTTPMRRAKGKIASLIESSEDDDEEEEANDHEDDEQVEEAEEDDEVDELVSAISTPPPKGRSPIKRRLRSRKVTASPPSDGDDEDEDEDGEEGDADEDMETGSQVDESEEDAEEVANMSVVEEEDGDDEATIAVEPRKLRNGKVVGEEDANMDLNEESDSIGDDDEQDEHEDEGVDVSDPDAPSDEETMDNDEDVDLTIATAKTLVRLRRDDLVRLCETRDLEPIGTKPQLAVALLQWRDQQAGMSSPSSTGTIRPPSTPKRNTRKRRSSPVTPILLRDEHFHMDSPRTPPLDDKKEPEPELELDLGTLGLEDREIPPEKLQKLEKIGSGGFKDVFVGKFRGRKIAIAEFRGQLSSMDIKELKLLGGFDHPNIVRFLGVSIPENTRETPVMIVSELCANGDLFDYIRNVNPPSYHKVLSIMLDIARGLEYLHLRKPSVIHRDCKSSNILITTKGTAKIADFGLAKVKQSTRSMVRSLVGTVNWQAPELWHAHPKYNHKVDVFSCACVYWEMLQWHNPNKKFPWEGMNEHAIYDIVGAKRQRPSLTGLRKQWSQEVVDLIERMWAHDYNERPTMSEVVEALEELVMRR